MAYTFDQDPVFLILDPQFKVTGINKAGCKLLGYPAADIIGKDWFQAFMPQEAAARLKAECAHLMATDPARLKSFTKAVKTGTGNLRLVQWHNSVLHDSRGQVVGTISMGTEVGGSNGTAVSPPANGVRAVLSAALEAQEKERRIIAEELHENVIQIMATCKLLLQNNETCGAQPQMVQAIDYLQQAINRVRSLSHWLNPKQLSEIGLEAAILEMIQDLSPAGKPHISLQVSDGAALAHLAPALQLSLFRIIQEQCSNIVRYAQAGRAAISIELLFDVLELKVTDDGRGFDLHTTPYGLGLRNIKSRAENHDGSMHLDTAPGQGCRLTVKMPLP